MTTASHSSSALDTGTDKLLLSVRDGIARVTLNNPERHNALSIEMRDALPATLAALSADPDVRVIVLTGAGDRAFSAGADISEFAQRSAPPATGAEPAGEPAGGAVIGGPVWSACTKPVIAMIRGYCLGGGLLLALQADIRLAASGSRFGIPAGKLGVGYRIGGVVALLEVVGPAWTSEILFSARHLSAEEAYGIGLVNRVVPGDELEDQVIELAHLIAANAPLTIAACKAAIMELRREPEARELDRVQQLMDACYLSEDYREGQRAFRERRSPRFTGR
jgi:enoyl-CoA hydratase/carnithine racemase